MGLYTFYSATEKQLQKFKNVLIYGKISVDPIHYLQPDPPSVVAACLCARAVCGTSLVVLLHPPSMLASVGRSVPSGGELHERPAAVVPEHQTALQALRISLQLLELCLRQLLPRLHRPVPSMKMPPQSALLDQASCAGCPCGVPAITQREILITRYIYKTFKLDHFSSYVVYTNVYYYLHHAPVFSVESFPHLWAPIPCLSLSSLSSPATPILEPAYPKSKQDLFTFHFIGLL